jgi:adenylate kinase
MNHLNEALANKQLFPFIAPPNGGKGTQTHALLSAFPQQLRRIDMGALLRAAAADENNPLGEKIRTAQNAGQLVSIDIVMDVLAEGMAKEAANASGVTSFILDGFPRNTEQLDKLEALCNNSGAKLTRAIYLDVSDEAIIARASGRIFNKETHQPYSLNNPALHPPGYDAATFNLDESDYYQRDDDKPETVAKRLQGFARDTQPIVETLEQQGKLLRLDGNQPAEMISKDLIERFNTLLNPATV